MALDTKTLGGPDAEVLKQITTNVDTILAICSIDPELRNYTLKFQLEQAADKAAFESGERTDGKEHMKRVLQRMADLSLAVATHVLNRTLSDARKKGSLSSTTDSANPPPKAPSSPPSPSVLHSSSVEDFSEGTDAWLESGAHLSFASVEVLSLILVAHSELTSTLQSYMHEQRIVDYLSEAFGISRDHELNYFQEGYRTGHMRLTANLSYSNGPTSEAIALKDGLLVAILSGTKIDEENPGMVEWAKFTVRNLCTSAPEASERIKQLKAMGLSSENEKLLSGKVSCSILESGKLQLSSPHS